MFNTLGNLLVNPNAGLLLIDFEQGHTLQLTGKAQIIWEDERLTRFAGAERLIEFHIEQVIETANATQLRWKFGEYSPANPAFEQKAFSAVPETGGEESTPPDSHRSRGWLHATLKSRNKTPVVNPL